MNNSLDQFSELDLLVAALNDGALTQEQDSRLEQLVIEDITLRQHYLSTIFVYGKLRYLHAHEEDLHADKEIGEQPNIVAPAFMFPSENASPLGQVGFTIPISIPEIPENQSVSESSHTPTIPPIAPLNLLNTAYHGTVGFFSQEMPFGILMATLFMIVGGVIGLNITKEHYTQMPGRSVASADRSYAAPESDGADKAIAAAKEQEEVMQFVGRITGMVDCRWADPGRTFSSSTDYLVALHDKYSLTSGLMEITYSTGAKVILQGPVTYEVESANGGYMSVGKLTGKVEVEKAKGFSVRTPTAVVTDLGTEFGVEVDEAGATLSNVFQGKVRFTALAARESFNKEISLQANESARVDAQGDVVVRSDVANSSTAFVRRFPRIAPAELLVVNQSFEEPAINPKATEYDPHVPMRERGLMDCSPNSPAGWHKTGKAGVMRSLDSKMFWSPDSTGQRQWGFCETGAIHQTIGPYDPLVEYRVTAEVGRTSRYPGKFKLSLRLDDGNPSGVELGAVSGDTKALQSESVLLARYHYFEYITPKSKKP